MSERPQRSKNAKPRPLTAMVNVRCLPEQLEELHAAANALGVDMAYVARRALALGLLPAEQEIQAAIDDAEASR